MRGLRQAGALTHALLLRSLLGGDRNLLAGALSELSGVPFPRVAAFMLNPYEEGFAALARRSGLKLQLLPAFRATLTAIKSHGGEPNGALKPLLIEKVIAVCERRDDPALAKAIALLWRFAAEAARAEASGFARSVAAQARTRRLPYSLDFAPAANDDSGAAPPLIIPHEAWGASAFAPHLRTAPGELESSPSFVSSTDGPAQRQSDAMVDNQHEDPAPPLELPIELIAALDQAA